VVEVRRVRQVAMSSSSLPHAPFKRWALTARAQGYFLEEEEAAAAPNTVLPEEEEEEEEEPEPEPAPEPEADPELPASPCRDHPWAPKRSQRAAGDARRRRKAAVA